MPRVAPSPIPAPLPPWAKWLLQVAPLIAQGLQLALDHIGPLSDSAQPTPSEWRHLQVVGSPQSSVDPGERFVTTFDVVNITGSKVDSSWTQQDYDLVASNLDALLLAISTHMAVEARWQELRFYRRLFNPVGTTDEHGRDAPYAKSGPPTIIYPMNRVGSLADAQAPQVAITTTDRTPYAKHWGRNYWPWPGAPTCSPTGRITTTIVNAYATALHTFYDTLMRAEMFPVVTVTSINKTPARGLLGVSEIQVDDVFDVIRRRRSSSTLLRVVQPVQAFTQPAVPLGSTQA